MAADAALDAQKAQERAVEAQRAANEARTADEAEYKPRFKNLMAAMREATAADPDQTQLIEARYVKAMEQPDHPRRPTPKWERAFNVLRDVIRKLADWDGDTFSKIMDRYRELNAPPVAPTPSEPPVKSEPEPEQPKSTPPSRGWGGPSGP